MTNFSQWLKRQAEDCRSIFRTAKEILIADRTFKQKLNIIMISIQRRLRKINVWGYPLKLTIDPGNLCNVQCALCPAGTKAAGRKRSFMDFHTFKKILDEIGDYLWAIDLFNWGEPLLNKDIFKMIEYAVVKKIEVTISTNLNCFDEAMCDLLVRSGLHVLIVSLDGASQESVEKYQRGSDFKLVTRNIRMLVSAKERANRKRPFVVWRFLVNKYNEHEIEKAKALAEELGVDRLELGTFRCDMARELLLDNSEQYEAVKPWLPADERWSMYDYTEKQKKILKDICEILWTESTIQPEGSVSPCCAVWHEKFDFGNIHNTSFAAIWNGEKYKEARRINRGDHHSKDRSICYICKSNKAML